MFIYEGEKLFQSRLPELPTEVYFIDPFFAAVAQTYWHNEGIFLDEAVRQALDRQTSSGLLKIAGGAYREFDEELKTKQARAGMPESTWYEYKFMPDWVDIDTDSLVIDDTKSDPDSLSGIESGVVIRGIIGSFNKMQHSLSNPEFIEWVIDHFPREVDFAFEWSSLGTHYDMKSVLESEELRRSRLVVRQCEERISPCLF